MRLLTILLLSASIVACGDKTEDTGTDSTTEASIEPAGEPSGEPSGEPASEPSGEDTSSTGDTPEELGKGLYEANCASCHGDDATGVSAPSLLDKSDEQFIEAVQNGKGYMPAFPDLSDTDIGNIIAFVRSL